MKKGVLLIFLIIVSATQTFAYEFCDDGIVGEDNLRIISVDDMLKDNNKEWRWEPLQNIELEIRIENRNDKTESYTIEAVFVNGENKISLAESSNDLEEEITLSGHERKSVSLNFQIEEDADIGDYDLYIKFYKDGDENEECVENSEEQITIEKVELCNDGNVDENDLEIIKITDEKRDNSNEWKWAPGNEIEISVDVSNKDYSERNFIIELIMLDEDNNEVEFTKDSVEDEEELDEDEEENVEFNFKLSSDVEEGNYNLYAKMYDEDDEDVCTMLKAEEISNYKQIKIEKEENYVIVSKIIGPNEIQANSKTEYTATITNLGSTNEEKVLIIAYNRILELKETVEIENLESGEERPVKLEIPLLENSSLGIHKLLFSTEFEYDKKREIYKDASNSGDDIKYPIEVLEYVAEAKTEDIVENETVESENETVENINETIEVNETISEDTTEQKETHAITGNVIGGSDKASVWPITIGLLFVAIIGLFLFLKNPKKKKSEYIDTPITTRKYTARLD